ALPGDELCVIEGMHICQSFRAHQLFGFLIRFVPDHAMEDDLGAVAFGRGDLRRRRVLRHADDGAHAVNLGGQRDSLRMIPRRGADDATPLLLIWPPRELTGRYAY